MRNVPITFVTAIGLAILLPGPLLLAQATVIQLPTFQFFGVSTTVSVPDRGGAYLGGVSSASIGRVERGLPVVGHLPLGGRPFGDRAIAGHAQASSVSVSAFIHDFEAMDDELLGGIDPAAVSRKGPPTRVSAAPQGSRVENRAPAPQTPDMAGRVSIAELRRQRAAHQATEQAQARADFERGRALLAQGQPELAKICFRQAYERGDAELRARISAAIRNHLSTAPGGLAEPRLSSR